MVSSNFTLESWIWDKVRFWEDDWLGRGNLISMYPRLFSLSMDQGKTVREVGVWVYSMWRWRLKWRRVRFEWESRQEEDLIRYISTSSLSRDIEDMQMWGGDTT